MSCRIAQKTILYESSREYNDESAPRAVGAADGDRSARRLTKQKHAISLTDDGLAVRRPGGSAREAPGQRRTREDSQEGGIIKRGAKVARIYYYKMITGQMTLYIGFLLTADGKAADILVPRE